MNIHKAPYEEDTRGSIVVHFTLKERKKMNRKQKNKQNHTFSLQSVYGAVYAGVMRIFMGSNRLPQLYTPLFRCIDLVYILCIFASSSSSTILWISAEW